VESTSEQWSACHRGLIARDRWVIDGMKLGVLAGRLQRADAVVYLDLSTLSCLLGVARRRVRYRGQLRPDLGVYDRISWEFVRWIYSFRTRQRPRILDLLGCSMASSSSCNPGVMCAGSWPHFARRGAMSAEREARPRWAFADKLSPALVVFLAGWAAIVT